MNKETRQFIFGIIGVFLCGTGLMLGLRDMHNSLTLGSLMENFLFCIVELIGIIVSCYYILKNI